MMRSTITNRAFIFHYQIYGLISNSTQLINPIRQLELTILSTFPFISHCCDVHLYSPHAKRSNCDFVLGLHYIRRVCCWMIYNRMICLFVRTEIHWHRRLPASAVFCCCLGSGDNKLLHMSMRKHRNTYNSVTLHRLFSSPPSLAGSLIVITTKNIQPLITFNQFEWFDSKFRILNAIDLFVTIDGTYQLYVTLLSNLNWIQWFYIEIWYKFNDVEGNFCRNR